MTSLKVQFINQISELPAAEWNAIAGLDYPFMRHEFLDALEKSESVSPEAGWTPLHLTAYNDDDELVAIAPCYGKTHSYGEYVFDWSWANAYYQNGLDYYPKLLTAIPFTPCIGPRILTRADYDTPETYQLCVRAMLALCQQSNLSSWHLLLPQSSLTDYLDEMVGDPGLSGLFKLGNREPSAQVGLMKRVGSQFHWYNRGYDTFADYMGSMTSRKRKNVRREREKVDAQGITFVHLTGEEINDDQLDDFFVFYHATYMKRGQYGYLNRQFFDLLVESMPENLLFIFAQKEVAPDDIINIAVAMFFKGADTIYGRYWGCLDEYDQLHFETCYYQGIDYCIANNLYHFDSGAQGEHKIQRGFEPIETYSYHWVAHPQFRDAIANFVENEQDHVREYIEEAQEFLPFKKGEA
ncbi:MAG: GNAT family N-acetyltransferase [Chloroflexota bacterium]